MNPTRRGLPIAALVIAAGPAHAGIARPQGTYAYVDPGQASILEPAAVRTKIIYLNGCWEAGDCDIRYGFEDSRQNHSSQWSGDVGAFEHGTVAWDAVVECVKETYAPFGVVVTDEDPGDTPHFEAVVGGRSSDLGLDGDPQATTVTLGIAPFDPWECGIIDNAISFTFANMGAFRGSVPEICSTVAQETAHTFGLEHEALCSDPMTYGRDPENPLVDPCPERKYFTNVDADCGEYVVDPRACSCGSPTQNSFAAITAIFGEGTVEEPTVSIESPADGAELDHGWVVNATVVGEVAMSEVALVINGRVLDRRTEPPYAFIVPRELSDGRMHTEVRATNVYGRTSSAVIDVVQGAPCGAPSDCAEHETCVDGRCVLGPGQPGGLGEVCQGDGECDSDLCGRSDDGQFCAETCVIGAGGCPEGFGCAPLGEDGVCWKGVDDGGCAVGGGGVGGLGLVGLLGLLASRRRRRTRAS
jgi:hypothetical protein